MVRPARTVLQGNKGVRVETRATRFRGPRISRCRRCKTVLTLMGVLLSTAGAWAQSGQPGYSFLTSSQKPAAGPAVVRPTATSPPEPGAVRAMPGYAPIQASPGMPYQGAMPGPMGPMGGQMGMPMGGPMGGAPMNFDPYAGSGPGYPGGFGPGLPPDPVSTFGTDASGSVAVTCSAT